MYVYNYIKNKPTPFKIIGGLSLVYNVYMFIYSLTLSEYEFFSALAYFILLGGTALAFGVDALLIEHVKYKLVWYIEMVVIITLSILVLIFH